MEPWEQAAQVQPAVSPAGLEPWEQAAKIPGPDFAQRMSADFDKRVGQDQASLDRYKNNQQGIIQTGIQLIGRGGPGLAMDAAGNVIGSLARYAGDAVGLNTPDAQGQTPWKGITNDVADIADKTGISKVAGAVGNVVNNLREKYPATMNTAGAVGDIASLVPVSRVARGAYDAAEAAYNARRLSSVEQMIRPEETKTFMTDNGDKYTSNGLLNKRTYNPDKYEADAAKTVATLPVKPSAPLEDNIQVVKAARVKKAQEISSALGNVSTPIDPVIANKNIQAVHQAVMGNPLVQLDGETAQSLMKIADKVIASNPNTASGLWKARKDFDAAIKDFQPNALDVGASAKTFSFTAKQIRNGINQTIIDSAPNAPYAEFLKQYSQLEDAADNMASKLKLQPASGPARFAKTKLGQAIIKGTGYGGAVGAGAYAIKRLGNKMQDSNDYSTGESGD